MKKDCFIVLCLAMAVVLLSCKPRVPSGYIQPGDMENILYDYYMADGMANCEYGEVQEQAYNNRLYKLAVLKKHGVTQSEFDSSLVYYARHADRLHSIYENIEKRLGNAAIGMGASAGDLQQFGSSVSHSDTADVWNEERSCVLHTGMPYNVLSYAIKADTAFHKGDRMVLSFDTHFIYQDGTKDGVALLAVRLSNDSVVSRTIHMSSDSHYTLNVVDDGNIGIKDVYGFIFLTKNQNTSFSTMKMMFVDNIRLVRLHNTSDSNIHSNGQQNINSGDTLNENTGTGRRSEWCNSPSRKNIQSRHENYPQTVILYF